MLRLLVVDDEVDVCDFVRNFFRERNFDVIVAYDGKAAVDAVNLQRPEIVLLDLRMPVMGGLEALKEIRSIDENIKVIVVTAVEEDDPAGVARTHGAEHYITKPLLLEHLEKTVLDIAEIVKKERANTDR